GLAGGHGTPTHLSAPHRGREPHRADAPRVRRPRRPHRRRRLGRAAASGADRPPTGPGAATDSAMAMGPRRSRDRSAALGRTDWGDGTARQGLRPLGGILAHVVGWPPRFLTREILDPLPTWMQPPSATRSATALLLVLAAVLVLVDAVRRRDRIAVAGQAIGF